MRRQITRWDILFLAFMAIGVAAATFHIVGGRTVNGVLALAAATLGAILVISSLRQPATAHPQDNGIRSGRRSPVGQMTETDDRESWLREAIIAGFVATVVMSGVMIGGYLFAGAVGNQNGNQIARWFWGLTHNSLTDSTWDVPIGAYSLNLFAGILWAVVYGWLFVGRLPGRGWQRGMLFSIVPWLLSLVVFFPLVGAGIFGIDLDAGPLPALGNLILHLAYGATLGVVYALPESQTASEPEAWATRAENRGIAVGLVSGSTVGVIIGAVLGLLVDPDVLGPTELLLICAAIGTMIGALIGPFAGLQFAGRDHSPTVS
jgi:hypothetical protein